MIDSIHGMPVSGEHPALVRQIRRDRQSRPGRTYRVALVTEYYYPHMGGICEHVEFLARELRRRGHYVDIITSRLGREAAPPGVIRIGRSLPVYFNGSLARITVGYGVRRHLRRVLRAGRYDIVHVHSPLSPRLPLMAVEESLAPVVGTFHTYFPRSILYRIFRRAVQRRLDRIDAAIAVSDTAADAFARYFATHWQIIPNGVDTTMFRPDVVRPAVFEQDASHILFLGRLDPRNGLTPLMESFRRIRARRRGRTRLVVAGDGPLRGHYERLAHGDPDIVFVGTVRDDRPGYYAHSDVYACPTTRASFGITLLEAMACGTPIVCSDLPGFRNVVKPDREALLVPCDGDAALDAALLRMLDDPVLRARCGAAGRESAQRFAWPRVTDEVLAVYDRVTANAHVKALF
jgi:phosphatidylinositol alpha-mannosyltransferase